MNILDKILDIIDRILNFIIYSLFLLLLIFGIYCIHSNLSILEEGNLPKEITKYRPTANLKLKELQKINGDIVGWIAITGTNVDYPIVQGMDNLEYLNKNYKREFSLAGCIFMDYRNSSDIIDNYTILFGHNMEKNKMFSDINEYQDKSYFDSHNKGTIHLGANKYDFVMISFINVDGYDEDIYNVNTYKTSLNANLINKIKTQSDIYEELGLAEDSKIVLFSTCSRSDEKKRSVAIGKIVDEK